LQLHTQHEAGLIEQAISQALAYGCVHYEGVRLCLNQLLLPDQAHLSLDLAAVQLAHLQQPDAQPVDLQQYDRLIGDGSLKRLKPLPLVVEREKFNRESGSLWVHPRRCEL